MIRAKLKPLNKSKFIPIFDRHMELVKRVNESRTEEEHERNMNIIHGFRLALNIIDVNQLKFCDMYYTDKGIDRPMCGGVFLDWTSR